jgi:hypothetical protein
LQGEIVKLIFGLMLILLFSSATSKGSNDLQNIVHSNEILAKIKNGSIVEYNNAIIKGNINLDQLNLPKARLSQGLSENAVIVLSQISITDCRIEGSVDFQNADFQNQVDFKGTEFNNAADFSNSAFNNISDFRKSKFNSFTKFDNNKFYGDADFRDASFNGNASFNYNSFCGDANFANSRFRSQTDFGDSKFDSTANFRSAQFDALAHFEGAIFMRSDFSNTVFIKGVKFDEAKFNGPTTFKSSKFNESAYFTDTKFNDSANFEKSVFLEDAIFRSCNFEEAADFATSSFNGTASFYPIIFDKDATFEAANFNGLAFLIGEFNGDANFHKSSFGYYTDFIGSTFFKNADFSASRFGGDADFRCQFRGGVDFGESRFCGNSDFGKSQFTGDAVFDLSSFNKTKIADFSDTQFNKTANFRKSCFNGTANFMDAKFSGDALFEEAWFRETLNLNRTKYDRLYVRWDHINRLAYNETSYQLLIDNFKKIGLFNDANECYYNFMENFVYVNKEGIDLITNSKSNEGTNRSLFGTFLVDRIGIAGNLIGKIFMLIFYVLVWVTYGFGTKPEFPLIWSIFLITFVFGPIWYYVNQKKREGLFENYGSTKDRSALTPNTGWNKKFFMFIDATRFSTTVFLSGTKLFVDPPKCPRVLECGFIGTNLKHIFTLERTLGALFFFLFFFAISRTVVVAGLTR